MKRKGFLSVCFLLFLKIYFVYNLDFSLMFIIIIIRVQIKWSYEMSTFVLLIFVTKFNIKSFSFIRNQQLYLVIS